MTEFELKFQIPPQRVDAVLRALARGKTRGQQLEAHYFDTPDQALALRGVTLRLRKEGRRWVQTAKAAGKSLVHRLEHNVDMGTKTAAGIVPAVDWRRHAASPLGGLLAQVLETAETGGTVPPLGVVCQTRVRRQARVVSAGRAAVEVALDRGWIEANGRRVAVSELEFELKKGTPGDAIALARRWRATHGGWLDTVSKAERGQRLARDQLFAEARIAAPPDPQARSGHEFGKAVLHECLEQVLANASEVAAGSTDAEHVHQLRVGVRRLRTAMRELAPLLPTMPTDWDASWVRLFRELGRHRDRHYLEQLQLKLQASGGPALNVESAAGEAGTPATAVRSAGFQDALLVMLGVVHGNGIDELADTDAKQVKTLLGKRLGKLRKAVMADGKHFDELTTARQHRVRKRLKRLRYLAEFAPGLFHRKEVDRYADALKPLQAALGDYHDELLALQHYGQWAAREPLAWFGAGWLGARRLPNAHACTQAVRALAGVRPFWK